MIIVLPVLFGEGFRVLFHFFPELVTELESLLIVIFEDGDLVIEEGVVVLKLLDFDVEIIIFLGDFHVFFLFGFEFVSIHGLFLVVDGL